MIAHDTWVRQSKANTATISDFYARSNHRFRLMAYELYRKTIKPVEVKVTRRLYSDMYTLHLINGTTITLSEHQPFLTSIGLLSINEMRQIKYRNELSRPLVAVYYRGKITYSRAVKWAFKKMIEGYEIKLKSRKYCFLANGVLLYSARTTNGKIRKKSRNRVLEGSGPETPERNSRTEKTAP